MSIIAHSAYRRWKSRAIILAMGLALLAALVPLVSLLFTLVNEGGSAINWRFLTRLPAPVGEVGGVGNAIVGSLLLLLGATVAAGPVGLGVGIFLTQRAGSRAAGVTRQLLDAMAGIPAIIVGVFIYTIVVLPMRRFSMLAGSLALAMIMLPIFARMTEEAVSMVPRTVEEAGLGLGIPRYRVILRIVLRSAMPAVLTGLFLALARVAGEAAPLLFTSFGDMRWPAGIDAPVASLPVLLFTYAISPFEEWHRQAWGAALLLTFGVLLVRLVTRFYTHWRYGPAGQHV